MNKILIVDDDKDFLVTARYFLVKHGFDVQVTTTCDEGLNVFYSFLPDLVLLDINVGSDDGREMCKKIKSAASHQHIPIILISANHEALKQYADYGANSVIQKPFEFSALLSEIKRYGNTEI